MLIARNRQEEMARGHFDVEGVHAGNAVTWITGTTGTPIIRYLASCVWDRVRFARDATVDRSIQSVTAHHAAASSSGDASGRLHVDVPQ